MLLESPRLLITDDNRDFRETLRGVFELRGFRTLLAADGLEAVEIVQTETIHLVLIDMHMPRLSGLEAIRRFKQHRAKLPCILISANVDDQIRDRAEQEQVFSLLTKPISCDEVTSVVHEALQATYGFEL